MNDSYWAEFYKTFSRPEPSDFAIWAEPRITGGLIYDMGAGDCMDTQYFSDLGHDVVAIEPCIFGYGAEGYMKYGTCGTGNTVYARWFLHAVEEEVEDQLLEWTQ